VGLALTPTPLPRERDLFSKDEYVVLTDVAVAITIELRQSHIITSLGVSSE